MQIAPILQCSPYTIELSTESAREIGANVQGPNLHEHFIGKQIKYGVMGNLNHQHLLERIQKVGTEKFCAFPFPRENPTELWIFEAGRMAGLAIRQGKEELYKNDSRVGDLEKEFSLTPLLEDENLQQAKQRKAERQKDEIQRKRYKQALRQFTIALKLQKAQKGETADIEQAISHIQKEKDLLKWKQNALLYLPNLQEVVYFESILETYKGEPNFYECLEQLVVAEAGEQSHPPHYYWLQALVHERHENWLGAMDAYLQLSENNPCVMACIEKAYTMLGKASLTDSQLQIRKDAARMIFEKFIVGLNALGRCPSPTCFICYNREEVGVAQWLKQTFVPDLMLAGIKPIVDFMLPAGSNLDEFQILAKSADLAIIVCTPELKAKYERAGLAQEIHTIRSRFNDEYKADANFPIFLKGERKESFPTSYFEATFGTDFSRKPFKLHYFSNALELFATMRKIPREEARKVAKEFVSQVKPILKGAIDPSDLANWQKEKALICHKDYPSYSDSVRTIKSGFIKHT